MQNKISDYLDFLKFCLHEDATEPESVKDMDWNGLLEFGKKQTIVGVLYHGLSRMANSPNRPNKYIIFRWYSNYAEIEENNKTVNRAANFVTGLFYKKYGYKGCILKGQGNALMYPNPYMRSAGDVDLYLKTSPVSPKEKSEDHHSIIDVIKLCRRIKPKCEVAYHHAEIGKVRNTEVEVHFRPSFAENLFYNKRLQEYFESVKDEQFKKFVSLPDNSGYICVPTDSFNRIFQLSHVHKHFLSEGVGLRQLIDYYYLLRRGCTDDEKKEFQRIVGRVNLTKFARGMMYVMKELFGIEDEYILIEPSRRIGRMIISEVLETGNFGYYDERFKWLKTDNVFWNTIVGFLRNIRFAFEFPSEVILGHPVWILWWHFYYEPKMNKALKEK